MLLKHLMLCSQDAQASSSDLQVVHIQSIVKAYVLPGCDRSPGVVMQPVEMHSPDEVIAAM